MPRQTAVAWHEYLNNHLAKVCELRPERFSLLASVPFPFAHESAAELERAVIELGAVGAVIAANVEGTNLGELDLDAFWSKAVELDVGVFIHPVQAQPHPRSAKFALSQIAQYTVDTTFTVGSLIFSGVLDRFPRLRLLLSHGGGTLPYLAGRFDVMHRRMDRAQQGDVAMEDPSAYFQRFYYDTILHDPAILQMARRSCFAPANSAWQRLFIPAGGPGSDRERSRRRAFRGRHHADTGRQRSPSFSAPRPRRRRLRAADLRASISRMTPLCRRPIVNQLDPKNIGSMPRKMPSP